jgi:anti-sigma B factor antagonist
VGRSRHVVGGLDAAVALGAMMRIDRDQCGSATILTPHERIDSSSAADLEQIALQIVRSRPARLVVDLHAIDYISSAGLRVVLLAAKESRATGVVCVLCGLQPAVLKVFETTGLTRILTIVTDRAVALETG